MSMADFQRNNDAAEDPAANAPEPVILDSQPDHAGLQSLRTSNEDNEHKFPATEGDQQPEAATMSSTSPPPGASSCTSSDNKTEGYFAGQEPLDNDVYFAGHRPYVHRIWWKRKRFWMPMVVLILIVVIVIPVAVTQALRNNDNESAPTSDPSQILPNTRMSAMDPRAGGSRFLFYQTRNGDIHYIELSGNRAWQGSRDLNISDARTNTPIATTSTVSNLDRLFWNLYYVDTNNVIQSYSANGNHNSWQRGTLGDLNYTFPVDSSADQTFVAMPGIRYNSTTNSTDGGITLLACRNDSQAVSAYTWSEQRQAWSNNGTDIGPEGCGAAAAATAVNGSSYLFQIGDNGGPIEMWHRDYRRLAANNDSNDPSWNQGPSSPVSIGSTSDGICADGNMLAYVNGGQQSVRGYNFTYANDAMAASTRWNRQYAIAEGDEMSLADGSALACWRYTPDGRRSVQSVFWQAADGAIRSAMGFPLVDGSSVPGRWEISDVPAR